MTILALNATEIKGYGHKVNCKFSLPESDLSGKSSSTAAAEEGEKACVIRVQLNIKYEDSEYLKNIKSLGMAKDETKGTRKVYNIENQTAKAFGVRQVRFMGEVSAQESEDVQAWAVVFTLIESLSISEKVEANKIKNEEPEVATTDEQVISEESSAAVVAESWLEKVLASLDSVLADEGTESNEV